MAVAPKDRLTCDISSAEATMTFIGQTMQELLAIVQSYSLDKDGEFSADITALRQRCLSKELTLVVLGEFSSGKSTFINSLLGNNLLAASAVPTTAVCTYIRYGEHQKCEALLQTGETVSILPEAIREFSAEGSRAFEVANLCVTAPLELLHNGLIVVDTPGVNVDIDGHVALTEAAIRKANACIYIMDGRQPGKKTTIDFLARIREIIPICFFVLNRADILDNDEQEEALTYLQDVLSTKLEIDHPRIYMLSASLALTDAENIWSKRFSEFIAAVSRCMEDDRSIAIAAEACALLTKVQRRVDLLLASRYSLIEEELAEHYKVMLPSSDTLQETLSTIVLKSIESEFANVTNEYNQYHHNLSSGLRNRICITIDSAPSKGHIRKKTPQELICHFQTAEAEWRGYLSPRFEQVFQKVIGEIDHQISEAFTGLKGIEQQSFLSRPSLWAWSSIAGFSAGGFVYLQTSSILFGVMSIIGGALFGVFIDWISFSVQLITSFRPVRHSTSYQLSLNALASAQDWQRQHSPPPMSAEDKKEIAKAAGTSALRTAAFAIQGRPDMAIISAVALPVILAVGSLLGSAWNGIKDWLFGPKLEELKRELRGKMLPNVDTFASQTMNEGTRLITTNYSVMHSLFVRHVELTIEKYRRVLDRIVSRQRKLMADAETKRDGLAAARSRIVEHANQAADHISLLREKLRRYEQDT